MLQTRLLLILWTMTWIVSGLSERALADGGTVRLVEEHGPWIISVFTAPNVPTTGPIDVSVLVQNAQTRQYVDDVSVEVTVSPREQPERIMHYQADTETATNKLFRAAIVEMPLPGRWQVTVCCHTPQARADAQFEMHVAPPLVSLPELWPWYSWPVAIVVIFGMHQWLALRTRPR